MLKYKIWGNQVENSFVTNILYTSQSILYAFSFKVVIPIQNYCHLSNVEVRGEMTNSVRVRERCILPAARSV